MFYCKPCGEERSWPTEAWSLKSYGRCEICERPAECFDVQSSKLPRADGGAPLNESTSRLVDRSPELAVLLVAETAEQKQKRMRNDRTWAVFKNMMWNIGEETDSRDDPHIIRRATVYTVDPLRQGQLWADYEIEWGDDVLGDGTCYLIVNRVGIPGEYEMPTTTAVMAHTFRDPLRSHSSEVAARLVTLMSDRDWDVLWHFVSEGRWSRLSRRPRVAIDEDIQVTPRYHRENPSEPEDVEFTDVETGVARGAYAYHGVVTGRTPSAHPNRSGPPRPGRRDGR